MAAGTVVRLSSDEPAPREAAAAVAGGCVAGGCVAPAGTVQDDGSHEAEAAGVHEDAAVVSDGGAAVRRNQFHTLEAAAATLGDAADAAPRDAPFPIGTAEPSRTVADGPPNEDLSSVTAA